MKNLELNSYGVVEMNHGEMIGVEGGNPILIGIAAGLIVNILIGATPAY